MCADCPSNMNVHQFQHSTVDMGEKHPWQVLVATQEGQEIGHMHWNPRGIGNVEVEPEHQRRGVATGLWQEGHRLASENAKIPAPKHSADRTKAGDAWAKSVGGRLPRRKT